MSVHLLEGLCPSLQLLVWGLFLCPSGLTPLGSSVHLGCVCPCPNEVLSLFLTGVFCLHWRGGELIVFLQGA